MGCCGKTYQPTVAPTPPEGWVLLEYTGSAIEPISFHSHVSGNNYRAGQYYNARVDYRFVHVDPMDVDYLIGRGFKLAPVAEDEEPAPTAKRSKK